MNLETKITIYKFTPQVFTLTHKSLSEGAFFIFQAIIKPITSKHIKYIIIDFV